MNTKKINTFSCPLMSGHENVFIIIIVIISHYPVESAPLLQENPPGDVE